MYPRYLEKYIEADLKERMIFMSGPRQVGKTFLAKHFLEKEKNGCYLNWDFREDKRQIVQSDFYLNKDFIVFDEIHKYKHWRNYLKGLFDKWGPGLRIIATGSARMDIFRKGGDSLFGRYRHYRLCPFSVAELMGLQIDDLELFLPQFKSRLDTIKFDPAAETFLNQIEKFSGFPEPCLKKHQTTLRRWRTERLERVMRQDLVDIAHIRDLSLIETLIALLPTKVSAPLSISNLAQDLEVTHQTVSRWLVLLEGLFYCFRVRPYSKKIQRTLKKESKYYLWDHTEIINNGLKRENIVAVHLQKLVFLVTDALGIKAELFYLRDKDKNEVDFLVTLDSKPWLMIEVKSSREPATKSLLKFSKRLNPEITIQLHFEGQGPSYDKMNAVYHLLASSFLQCLV